MTAALHEISETQWPPVIPSVHSGFPQGWIYYTCLLIVGRRRRVSPKTAAPRFADGAAGLSPVQQRGAVAR